MAATDSRPIPIKNTAYRAVFPILDADGDLVSGAAALDSEVSKDQGTFTDCTNEATEIATSSGMYYLDLTSTEMNADCVAVIVKTSSGKTTPLVLYPQEADDIRVAVTHWVATAVATPTVNGVPEVDVTHFNGSAGVFASGRPEVNTSHVAGTAQTARDLGAQCDATISSRATPAQVNTEVDTALADARLDELLAADSDIDGAAPPTVGSVFHELLTKTTGSFTYDQTTDSLEAVRDNMGTAQTGDAFARLGAPAGASVSADILAIDNFVDDLESRLGTPSNLGSGATISANLVDIEGQTDDIGTAGAGLTAIPWNASWDAEVQSEVDDALVARNLDKLVLLSGTADSGSTTTLVDAALTQADNDWWKGRMIVFTSGTLLGQCAIVTDFVAATDTITFAPPVTAAVSTHTYIILPGVSVWDDTLAEHLLSGSTGSALNSAGSAGDPWNTALPGAYGAGTAGKIVGDNLNAAISTRATPAQVKTEADTALSDVNLDHLVGTATGIPAIPAGTFLDQIMDDGTAAFDRTTDSLQAIRDRGDAAWTTGGGGSITDILNVVPIIPTDIDLANTATWRIGLSLTNALDDLPTTAEITPGTVSIDRKAAGGTSWTAVRTDVACSDDAGLVYYDETFSSGNGYATGDSLRITLKNQKITVSANDYEITGTAGRIFYSKIPPIPAVDWTSTERNQIRHRLGIDGTSGAPSATPSLSTQASVDIIDDFLDTEIAAIKAKTDNLPATPAATGDAMTLTAGERDAIADALLERNVAGASSSGRKVKHSLAFLRNKWTLSGATLTVYDTDDTTVLWTATVSTNASAEPITGSDPA